MANSRDTGTSCCCSWRLLVGTVVVQRGRRRQASLICTGHWQHDNNKQVVFTIWIEQSTKNSEQHKLLEQYDTGNDDNNKSKLHFGSSTSKLFDNIRLQLWLWSLCKSSGNVGICFNG